MSDTCEAINNARAAMREARERSVGVAIACVTIADLESSVELEE